ncbi:MAG: hypothetical protein K0B37_10910 [Bacteroidales bacterium]|nr:hypothetical protein [Bacteroidales bacterium]
MKIYLDENLPSKLAEGLNILEAPNHEGFEVLPMIKDFGKGAKDQDWIPVIGPQGGVVITQDLNINRNRQLKQLYLDNGLGIFFFSPPKKGYKYWDMVEQIIKRWRELKTLSRATRRPFTYRCTSYSKRFERM